MRRLSFRARLFIVLAVFAVVPATVLTFVWGGTMRQILPLMAGRAAWDTVSATGQQVVDVARRAENSAAEAKAIAEHERALTNSRTRAAQFELIAERAPAALLVAGLILVGLLTYIAGRVAGHLTRQLTRPLDEVVAWTGRISRSEALPPPEGRGAPEFAVLREGMQRMSGELEAGRRAALEAQRLATMRETARQVAHELKNPLTPIRFAVARLKGKVPAELAETVEVLDAETARLEGMARSFAQFGRLPDGPVAQVDVAELVSEAVRASVPAGSRCDVDVPPGLAVMGRYDALGRALGNVLVNAVEATGGSGHVAVDARAADNGDGVTITVRDDGPGIEPAKLGTIWEPYVTGKPGGTGLGLAIVRQTIEAHGGSVVARSTPGRGTEVQLTIPAGKAGSTGAH